MKKLISIFLIALGCLLFGGLVIEYKTGTLPGELKRIEGKGKSMVIKIEEFKRNHGQYPFSFAQAGILDTKTRFGDWQYEGNTNRFQLTVGNYSHGFVFGYSSWAGWWWDK